MSAPLRRGINGVCSRRVCECERQGLGDQCVWLDPTDAELERINGEPHIDGWPLYSGLPQRAPLTDEQIDALPWGPHQGNPLTFAEGLRDFARAVERAHGIGVWPQVPAYTGQRPVWPAGLTHLPEGSK